MGFLEIFKVIFVLGMLLGLMYLVLYLTKKFLFQGGRPTSSGGHMVTVLSTQMIMPKKYISVIQIDETQYIVGVSDNGFTLLDKMAANPVEMPEVPEDTIMKRLRGSIKF
ncbi:MAG: flagellar biosynthetic protein FliO [Ignavibacteria bacterium]|nr:flagellar biosynthetic protein FliO [Ignavibacteria bacterium]